MSGKKIVLISCVKSQANYSAPARELYVSSWFKKALRYAESIPPDAVFIISSRYGLIGLNDVIEPYDVELKTLPESKVREWACKVIDQLSMVADINADRFIFLGFNRYRQFIVPKLNSIEVPLKGLPIGKQLQFLDSLTS